MKISLENFPEIIRSASSGGLYGFLALIVLATIILAIWLINQKATIRQERVFIYIMIFFTAISGAVGIAAGFSSGSDVETSEPNVAISTPEEPISPEPNPHLVQLYEEDMSKLEEYLNAEGHANSSESKTNALSKAIDYLVEDSEPTSDKGGGDGSSFQEALSIGEIGEPKSVSGWIGNARPERYHWFQLLEASEVRLIWSDGVQPNILDNEARVVSWAGGQGAYSTSLNGNTYYIKLNRFPSKFEGDYQIKISAKPLPNP